MKIPSSDATPVSRGDIDRLEAVIRENTRDLIGHFQKGQKHQDERMDVFDGRMDTLEKDVSGIKVDIREMKQDIGLMKNAIVDLAEGEHHLRNLIRYLQREGIKITEAEVFAA